MRYFGGGIGHQGLRMKSTPALDDEVVDPDWQDMVDDMNKDQDTADAGVGDEFAAATACEEDLLRLVPEIAQAGVEGALQQELAAFKAAMDLDSGEEGEGGRRRRRRRRRRMTNGRSKMRMEGRRYLVPDQTHSVRASTMSMECVDLQCCNCLLCSHPSNRTSACCL